MGASPRWDGTVAVELVGRQAERRRIEDAIARVVGGSGAALLIDGESGIGKTSLARYGVEIALERGFRTLEGKSNPLNQGIAYGPVVEAFGRVLRDLEPVERHRLTGDLPALGRLFEGVDLPQPEPLGDSALDKTRLFEAVLRLLDRMSREAPVALLLDDLHWFDPTSLELLAYLSRDLSGLPVLVIGTVRTDDEQRPAVGLLLQSLRRTGVVDEITLSPLDEHDLAVFAGHLLGGDPPLGLVEYLAVRSGGVPLFAAALVEALSERQVLVEGEGRWMLAGSPDVPPPPVIHHAILQRLERLEGAERRLLELVAVGGDDVASSVLREVSTDRRVDAALAGLVDSGLLIELGIDELRYRFAHPLLFEVAYGELPASRRRRLHARFAAVLERREPDVERLALHYQRAQPADPPRALEVSVAAGLQALERYANNEAIGHFEAALPLARAHRPAVVVSVLTRLGEAAIRAGDLAAAIAAWEEAVIEYERAEDRAAVARTHRLMAEALVDWGEIEEALRHVEAGLAALEGLPPSDLHVELLLCRVTAALHGAEPAQAQAAAEEVSGMAARVGTERTAKLESFARGAALVMRGRYELAADAIMPAQEVLLRTEPRYLVRQEGIPGIVASVHGDLPTLREANRRALEVAQRVGIPASEHRLRLHVFVESFYSGEWDRCREALDEAELVAETMEHARIGSVVAVMGVVLHAFRADFAAAHESLTRLDERIARRLVPRGHGEKLAAVLSAVLALEEDEPAEAMRAIGGARGHYLPELLPPWGFVARGEAEAATGDAQAAAATAAELQQFGPEGSYPHAMAERLRGLAAVAAGRETEGIERLASAAAILDALGMPFEAARAVLERTEVAVRSSSAEEVSTDPVLASYRTMARLEAARYETRARHVLAALGVPVPSDGNGDGELTPRQQEVAALVAEGLSNAEIAERLYLSVRTVESHLDHIYTRLGINSRVALATYVSANRPDRPT